MSDFLNDFWGDGDFETLKFLANEPVNVTIVKPEEIKKDDKRYFKLNTTVLNGEHKGKEYAIFSGEYYKDKKSGEEKIMPTLRQIMAALIKGKVVAKVDEAEKNGIKKDDMNQVIMSCFEENLASFTGKTLELVFKPVDGKFQNIKKMRELTEAPKEATVPAGNEGI